MKKVFEIPLIEVLKLTTAENITAGIDLGGIGSVEWGVGDDEGFE